MSNEIFNVKYWVNISTAGREPVQKSGKRRAAMITFCCHITPRSLIFQVYSAQ